VNDQQKLKEIALVLQAYADGQTIQWNSLTCGNWQDWLRGDILGLWHNLAHDQYFELRIKPAPSKRLIRHEELPAVFWVRDAAQKIWVMVIAVSETGFCCLMRGNQFEPDDKVSMRYMEWTTAAHNDWEWSPDHKEGRSFYVKENT
jgi:hypothetical protein